MADMPAPPSATAISAGAWPSTRACRGAHPADGGAALGRTYVLRDAPGPGTWHYRLEDVGTDGKRGALPAAEVRVGPGADGSELFVPRAVAGRTGGD